MRLLVFYRSVIQYAVRGISIFLSLQQTICVFSEERLMNNQIDLVTACSGKAVIFTRRGSGKCPPQNDGGTLGNRSRVPGYPARRALNLPEFLLAAAVPPSPSRASFIISSRLGVCHGHFDGGIQIVGTTVVL